MKYALMIPDGAADMPVDCLEGRTPLQVADLPALRWIAAAGRLGTAGARPPGPGAGEAAAYLAALGYDPERYQCGEGALVAHARGLKTGPADHVLCCDFVTVTDGQLRDFTAGFISPAEAATLLGALNEALGAEPFRFHDCGGYRNLLVWRDAGALPKLRTWPPETVLHRPVRRHMPRGSGSRPLYTLMLRAEALLAEHDVNTVRRDLGENPASAIWLWGNGQRPETPPFRQRFGVRGVLVARSEVLRGIGRVIGWEVVDLGARQSGPTVDYAAEGAAAVAAVDRCDLVCVHAAEPHILGMLGLTTAKIRALEAFDRQVAGPLLDRLRREAEWRVLVIAAQPGRMTEHPRAELRGRTLCALAGTGIESHRGDAFDEPTAAEGELHPERVSDLMEYFLRR